MHQAITGKLNQTIGKTHNYPSVPKSYSTTCNGIGGHKKVEKISKSKTTTLTYFDNLKKKQLVKTGAALKILCHWQSKISELLHCFENKFWVALCFLW